MFSDEVITHWQHSCLLIGRRKLVFCAVKPQKIVEIIFWLKHSQTTAQKAKLFGNQGDHFPWLPSCQEAEATFILLNAVLSRRTKPAVGSPYLFNPSSPLHCLHPLKSWLWLTLLRKVIWYEKMNPRMDRTTWVWGKWNKIIWVVFSDMNLVAVGYLTDRLVYELQLQSLRSEPDPVALQSLTHHHSRTDRQKCTEAGSVSTSVHLRYLDSV